MQSAQTLQFGTFAKTTAGLPGIPRGTLVQICGIGVKHSKLQYAAIVIESRPTIHAVKFGQHTGPWPTQAFAFHAHCTAKNMQDLIEHITALQVQVEAAAAEAESNADALIRDNGAKVPKKVKLPRKKAVKVKPGEDLDECDEEEGWAPEPPKKKRNIKKALAQPKLVSAADALGHEKVMPKKMPKRESKEIAQDTQAYDNSHNWGHKGRVAQRAIDDLANTKNPPHGEI